MLWAIKGRNCFQKGGVKLKEKKIPRETELNTFQRKYKNFDKNGFAIKLSLAHF